MYAHCRKCAKCGKTYAEDVTVTYHRFPSAGTNNLTKAQAWAKYCYPNKVWDLESLQCLYNKCRFVCGRHFSDIQFLDSSRQKLSKFAVPDSPEVQCFLKERKNIFNEDPSSTPDPNRPESLPANQNNEDNRNKDKVENVETNADENFRPESLKDRNKVKIENVETNADDNFYTMDEDGVQDDLVDGDEINLESETQHDDVEFIDELRLDKDPETLKHSDFKCNVCRGEIVGYVSHSCFVVCASSCGRPQPHLMEVKMRSTMKAHGLRKKLLLYKHCCNTSPPERFRYVCVQCVDWDMCASCEARGEHPEHYVLRLPAPKPYAECEPVIAAIREQIEHLLLLRNEIKSEADSESEAYFEAEPNIDAITEDFDPNLTDPFSATTNRNVPKLDVMSQKQSDVADIEANISVLNTDPVIDRPQTRPILILAKPTLAQGIYRNVPELNISKKQSDIVANIPEVNTHLVTDRPKTGPKLILVKTKLAPGIDRNVPELHISKKSDTVANIPDVNTHPVADRPHTAPKLILTKSSGLAPRIQITRGPTKRYYVINSQAGSQVKKVKES